MAKRPRVTRSISFSATCQSAMKHSAVTETTQIEMPIRERQGTSVGPQICRRRVPTARKRQPFGIRVDAGDVQAGPRGEAAREPARSAADIEHVIAGPGLELIQ